MKFIFMAIILAAAWIPRTDTVTEAWTTICENDVTKVKNVTFRIKNTGVTNPFTDCRVQTWVGSATDDVAASNVLTMTDVITDGETVTLDTKTYTFQDILTDVDGNVKVGADASESLDNLIAAIMLGSGAGTKYAASMTLHPSVTAVAGAGDTVLVVAKDAGAVGNTIASTETLVNGTFDGDTLSGGIDAWTNISFSWDDCKSLAIGASSSWAMAGSSHEKMRVQAKSALGTTSYCRAWGN